MFQRYLSVVLLSAYSLFSLTCLSWSTDSFIRALKHTYVYLLSPATLPPLLEMDRGGSFGRRLARLIRVDQRNRELEEAWRRARLDGLRLRALEDENRRLSDLLRLPPVPGRVPEVARVLARDAVDWFHSLLLQKGRRDGIDVSDPVVGLQGGRVVLVGQVVEVYERICRVLLVTDPLSAVSARLLRTGEQGSVEGRGSDRLVMEYLLSDSDVRLGDEVVTAGLGHVFPEGVLLGRVTSVETESARSFKRARLQPAVRLGRLEELLILRREKAGRP